MQADERGQKENISIHAPTRGATTVRNIRRLLFKFQSTLLQEERHDRAPEVAVGWRISIHAPTRGATQRIGARWCSILYFNPRSYKRSDRCGGGWRHGIRDFNPRSYKRSDILHCRLQQRSVYFNPRSYKRSDFDVRCIPVCLSISIHAPTRGATKN